MTDRPGIRGSLDGVPEEGIAELERMLKVRGFRVGIGGYDRVLLDEAKRSAERARVALEGGRSGEEAGATASAILCSSAACEARVSEYLAHEELMKGPLDEALSQIRSNRNAREQWRDLLRHVAPQFEAGRSTEYQQLGCLFRVRDLVAHRNARARELDTWPPLIEPCVRQGRIPVRDAQNADWTSVLFVAEVASWAASVAEDWLEMARELAPTTC